MSGAPFPVTAGIGASRRPASTQMVHSPDSASYMLPNTPSTPGDTVKDESRRPSLDAASAAPSVECDAAQGRRGGKKSRSIINMTQEQRDRKRENGRTPVLPSRSLLWLKSSLFSFESLAAEMVACCHRVRLKHDDEIGRNPAIRRLPLHCN